MPDLIALAKYHRAADMLESGEWFNEDSKRGCSIGCFNHDLGNDPSDFAAFADAARCPEWAAQLQEWIFERLPVDKARDWHVDCVTAYAIVPDWTAVYHKTMIGVLEIALPHDKSKIVQRVIDLHKRGKEVTENAWKAARTDASESERNARSTSQLNALWSARNSTLTKDAENMAKVVLCANLAARAKPYYTPSLWLRLEDQQAARAELTATVEAEAIKIRDVFLKAMEKGKNIMTLTGDRQC